MAGMIQCFLLASVPAFLFLVDSALSACSEEELSYDLSSACAFEPFKISVPGVKDICKDLCGTRVNKADFATKPIVKYNNTDHDEKYVLVMMDPDAKVPEGTKGAEQAEGAKGADDKEDAKDTAWLHWLKVNVDGDDFCQGEDGGQELTEYLGPAPPEGTGIHRYQFFIIPQGGKTIDSAANKLDNRDYFSLKKFLSDLDICSAPVASVGFQAAFEDV